MSEIIVIISSFVTALATVALMFVGFSNLYLARSIRKRNEEHEQEMKKLLQTLVIARLSGPYHTDIPENAFHRFKKNFKDRTSIFSDEIS